MNSKELKELVKQHFSLTEVSFGEVKDINGAFTFLFEGDVLEVGKDVKVRTTEGQEMSAPDGYHELENGMVIKVEGGKVAEITTASTEATEEMAVEEISNVEGVINEDSQVKTEMEEVSVSADVEPEVAPVVEEVAKAVIEAVKSEIEAMKKEMADMKAKLQAIEDSPATDKTEPEVQTNPMEMKKSAEPFNKERFTMVMERAMKK